MMAALVAALGAGGALLLAAPRVPAMTRRSREHGPERSLLERLRIPLALLAGVAAWAFLGGVTGVVAGLAGVRISWQVLARVRSPAEVRREQQLQTDYPLLVELLAASLAAGADVISALKVAGSALGDPWQSRLGHCLHALEMGQAPALVWAELEQDPVAGQLGRALARSHSSGVPVAEAMRRLAHDLHEASDLAAQAYVRTIEVRTAVPLGVCFLPGFIVIGVIPLVVGVLSRMTWIGG